VTVSGEQAEDAGGTGRQNDVQGVTTGDQVEDLGEVEHGFRPRLKRRELDRMTQGEVKSLSSGVGIDLELFVPAYREKQAVFSVFGTCVHNSDPDLREPVWCQSQAVRPLSG